MQFLLFLFELIVVIGTCEEMLLALFLPLHLLGVLKVRLQETPTSVNNAGLPPLFKLL